MAYFKTDEEDDLLKAPAAPGSGLTGAPAGGTPGAPAPAQQAPKAPGTGFTNLQTYLGLNKGVGDAMAGKVTSNLNNQFDQTKKLGGEVEAGTIKNANANVNEFNDVPLGTASMFNPYGANGAANAQQDHAKIAHYQAKSEEARRRAARGNDGIYNYEQHGQYGNLLNTNAAAGDDMNATGNKGGLTGLLREAGQQRVSRFDLASARAEGQDEFGAARNSYQQLQKYLQGAHTSANKHADTVRASNTENAGKYGTLANNLDAQVKTMQTMDPAARARLKQQDRVGRDNSIPDEDQKDLLTDDFINKWYGVKY